MVLVCSSSSDFSLSFLSDFVDALLLALNLDIRFFITRLRLELEVFELLSELSIDVFDPADFTFEPGGSDEPEEFIFEKITKSSLTFRMHPLLKSFGFFTFYQKSPHSNHS